MKLRPLNDRILVEKVSVDNLSSGGIIIPDTAKEKPIKGKVLAKGEGKWKADVSGRIPIVPEVGQMVIFGKYHAGTEIKSDDGADHMIIREEDIMLIVEN